MGVKGLGKHSLSSPASGLVLSLSQMGMCCLQDYVFSKVLSILISNMEGLLIIIVIITKCDAFSKTGLTFMWNRPTGGRKGLLGKTQLNEKQKEIQVKSQKVYKLSNLILRAGPSHLVSEIIGEKASWPGHMGGDSWGRCPHPRVPQARRPGLALLCPLWGAGDGQQPETVQEGLRPLHRLTVCLPL